MLGNTHTWWCYLDQIQENYTEKEKSDIDVNPINLENEYGK